MAESVAHPVFGGDSLYSYSKNSSFQRQAIDAAKELIKEAIIEKLDIKIFSSSNTFRVTDLGCAAGPNTFVAVQNILDALEHKYQSQEEGVHNSDQLPEFQVFFNDTFSNDFNELFQSLPPDRRYYAVGVPGSYYSRLYPKNFLHFVYSSYAVSGLSKVPKEVVDMNSPAWNKGRIFYSNSADEVAKAYAAQYAKDMECFLSARAQEIVYGGLMAIIVPGRPNGTPHAQIFNNMAMDLLGSCLMDMANKGIITEDKVDSFNIPIYNASPEEVEAIVKGNGYFSIERMENFPHEKLQPMVFASTLRGGMGRIIQEHFEDEILDELFDSLSKKVHGSSSIFESGISINLFVLLKRKATE